MICPRPLTHLKRSGPSRPRSLVPPLNRSAGGLQLRPPACPLLIGLAVLSMLRQTRSSGRPLAGDSMATAEDVALRLNGRRMGEWWTLRGYCHGSGDKQDSNSLRIRDGDRGGLFVKCFAGCDRSRIIDALESRTGLQMQRNGTQTSYSPSQAPQDALRPSSRNNQGQSSQQSRKWDGAAIGRRMWQASVPIPQDSDHPARRWLAQCPGHGPVWRSRLELPSAVRFVERRHIHRDEEHQGVGAIITLLASPKAWEEAWPNLPAPAGVHLVNIDAKGAPALDRRDAKDGPLNKRSYGPSTGAVAVLGDPRPIEAAGVHVAEGLADALALASRFLDTAVAICGTSGMMGASQNTAFLQWLASIGCPGVWEDQDGPGKAAAATLARALARHCHPDRLPQLHRVSHGGDPAAAAAAFQPLPAVELRDLASDLQANGLPSWEAWRQASNIVVPSQEAQGGR